MAFHRAEKRNARLRLALAGPSGSGKTYTALLIAQLMGSKIGVIDSERGSASLYSDEFKFDVTELESHATRQYRETIAEAAANGYDVLIIDSFSHSWMGIGGALETVDRGGGWTKAGKVVTPAVQGLIDAILHYPGHVIATMRAKSEVAIDRDAAGKISVRKVGLAPQVRDGTEYEFSFFLDLQPGGMVHVSKTRCRGKVFQQDEIFPRDDIPGAVERIKAWLNSGAALTPVEEMAERIRFCQTEEQLSALVPEIAKLSPEDRVALRPVFLAKKAELQGVLP